MQSESPGGAGVVSASRQTGCLSRCLRQDGSSSGFIHFFSLFCLGTLGTFSLSSRFFFQLTSSLSLPPRPFAHSAVCVSIAASHQINLHLPQPPGHSITNFTSRLCLSVDGFEVCCEMCGWGKKIFSPSKKK